MFDFNINVGGSINAHDSERSLTKDGPEDTSIKSIMKFNSRLPTSISKASLLNKSKQLEYKIKEHYLPILSNYTNLIKPDVKLTNSTLNKEIAGVFEGINPKGFKDVNMFSILYETVKGIMEIQPTYRDLVEKHHTNSFLKSVMSIRDSYLVSELPKMEWYIQTARLFFSFVVNGQVNVSNERQDEKLSKLFKKKISKEQYELFLHMTNQYHPEGKHKITMDEFIINLPDSRVTESNLQLMSHANYGTALLDILGINKLLNLINPQLWLIFPVVEAMADIDAYVIELEEKELKYMELQYEQLLLQENDKNKNPRTEKQLKNLEKDINDSRYKIQQLKRSWNIEHGE